MWFVINRVIAWGHVLPVKGSLTHLGVMFSCVGWELSPIAYGSFMQQRMQLSTGWTMLGRAGVEENLGESVVSCPISWVSPMRLDLRHKCRAVNIAWN